jgi:hypothetical protein
VKGLLHLGPLDARIGPYKAARLILERLARVIDPEHIPVWLHEPVPALGDEKPIDLLARGEWQPVVRVISGLESQGFS